jgi:Fe-S-cluster containining protein
MSRAPSNADEWYSDGLRFACTMCGNCCTGPEGVVWFTAEEGRRIAGLLGVDEKAFYRDYARKLDEGWSLNERRTEFGLDCVFLDRQSVPGKAVCGIYDARPTQCRTWPFWPDNLRTRRTWDQVKRRTPCPGMDSGKLVPIEQIRIQRDATSS